MIRTQVYLTQKERTALMMLADKFHSSQSKIIRYAIDEFIKTHTPELRRKKLLAAKGLWKNRKDLPDFLQIRKEFDRREDL